MLERFTKSLLLFKCYLNLNLICVFARINIRWCTTATTLIVLQKIRLQTFCCDVILNNNTEEI
jgi:hypothetical protein